MLGDKIVSNMVRENIGSHCGDNRRSCTPGGLAENVWDTFVFAAAEDLTVSQFSNYK